MIKDNLIIECTNCHSRHGVYSACLSEATQPEPAPIRTDEPHIWDLVIEDIQIKAIAGLREPIIADMRARDAMGFERYGAHLQASNGRNPLVHAYQEALDLTVYLRQALERGYPVDEIYHRSLGTVVLVKASLMAMG